VYDLERIARITGDIDRYLHDLSLISRQETTGPDDKIQFYALSMVLFSLLDSVIDLGSEVVAGSDLGVPSTYRHIFTLLAERGTIDREMLLRMSLLVSYRNRLAHEYGEITPDDLSRIIAMAGDIQSFVTRMKAEASGSARV